VRLVATLLSALCLAALLSAVAVADEAKAEKKEEPKKDPYAQQFSFPKEIKLTKEQEEKLAALRKEFTPRLDALNAKIDKVMTPERKKVATATRKEATTAGKKGKEIDEAIAAALKLSPEEEQQRKANNQERNKLMRELNEKKMGLLTEEQKTQLKPKTDK
jgi:hypothetical protein